MGATLAFLCVAIGAATGHGATSSTVVSATVPSATYLDIDPALPAPSGDCLAGTAGRTDLGVVLPGASATTTLDCEVAFGSSNDTAMLRLFQTDGGGVAMSAMPASGVTAAWSFNGTWANLGTLGAVADAAPAAPSGDPAFVPGSVERGQAAAMDGNDFALVPHHADLSKGSDFTVDVWFRTSTISESVHQVLAQKSVATGCTAPCTWSLEVDASQDRFCLSATVSGTGRYICSPAGSSLGYADGAWHHVAATMDSGNIRRLYIDGALAGGPSSNWGTVDPNTHPVSIGASSNPSNFFNGELDELRYHSAARSAAEIRSYYLGAISDYADDGTADWDTATAVDLFGACLRAVADGAATSVGTWSATGDCSASDAGSWNPVPATATPAASVATNGTSGDADARVSLRFGFRTRSDQPPGTYRAPLTFEVVAPAA